MTEEVETIFMYINGIAKQVWCHGCYSSGDLELILSFSLLGVSLAESCCQDANILDFNI